MDKNIADMMTLIERYLESKRHAWADTTKRNERHRLNALAAHLSGDADALFAHLRQSVGRYTLVTAWVRVTDFWEFLIEEGTVSGPNPYRVFKRRNAKAFKHAYQPKLPAFDEAEARRRIARIQNPASQAKALQLLEGGLRFSESLTLKDGVVTGKGGKPRRVFAPEAEFGRSYRSFARDLAAVGLTAHQLRKLAATRMAQGGANEADLCEVFGWASFQTARAYVAPRREEKLKEMLKGEKKK